MPSAQHEQLVRQLGFRQPAVDVAAAREQFERLCELFPFPPDVEREPADAGGVRAEWIRAPEARRDRTLLYFHGGGYAIGSIATHRRFAARISRATGASLLLIDYRLAPEQPYPAALEDALRAYRWLAARCAPHQMAIGGESSGGGLTLSTLMALRDAGEPLPAAAACLSPWTDLACTGASCQVGTAIDDPLLRPETLQERGASYAGAAGVEHPGPSPLYGSFEGLPPLLVQVGTRDLLLDDALRAVDRARAAGVEVISEVEEGLIHCWTLFGPRLPETARSLESLREFLDAHWGR